MRRLLSNRVGLIAPLLLALCGGATATATAAPPAYVLLRRAESPGKHYQQGHADASLYEARTSGYAYGYFGVAPRSHASRHFGYYRAYTQWSTW